MKPVADSDLELTGRGTDFDLLALLPFLRSVISSFLTPNKPPPRAPLLYPPLQTVRKRNPIKPQSPSLHLQKESSTNT